MCVLLSYNKAEPEDLCLGVGALQYTTVYPYDLLVWLQVNHPGQIWQLVRTRQVRVYTERIIQSHLQRIFSVPDSDHVDFFVNKQICVEPVEIAVLR